MKKYMMFFCIMTIAISLTGCEDDKVKKIGVFYNSYKDDYTNSVRSYLDRNFIDDEDISHINYNAQENGEKQLSQIQKAIEEGYSLLLVNACNEEITGEITAEAREANIPLVYFERPVSKDAVYEKGAFVSADFREEGKLMGKAAGKYLRDNYSYCDLNGDGRINYVIYLQDDRKNNISERLSETVEAIDNILSGDGKPAIEYFDSDNALPYVLTEEGRTEFDTAKEHMLSAISAYESNQNIMPELVLATNDSMALGAADALREKGISGSEKNIPVFGIGGTPGAENAVENGLMTCTVKTDPMEMANAVEEIAENFLDGDRKLDDIKKYKTENNWRVYIESRAETGFSSL